jgi:hypothetical protein
VLQIPTLAGMAVAHARVDSRLRGNDMLSSFHELLTTFVYTPHHCPIDNPPIMGYDWGL